MAEGPRVILIGWTDGFTAYRRLSAVESAGAAPVRRVGQTTDPVSRNRPSDRVLVPWKCTHLVPELPAELDQAPRYQAFAEFSGSTTGLIGFDCVPVMAAETTAEGMPIGFAHYLAAAAHVDRIATISAAAELEYRGWRTMLAGTGLTGPDIRCIPLPGPRRDPHRHRPAPSPATCSASAPCPSSSPWAATNPAKTTSPSSTPPNCCGEKGCSSPWSSWAATPGTAPPSTPRSTPCAAPAGPSRPSAALPDDLLWAAYRQAYCTVFASLHEGYGLPVAESLASGTPVITSNFGSMRDLASHGGALLVDPRQGPPTHRRPAPTPPRPTPPRPPGRPSRHHPPPHLGRLRHRHLGLPRQRQPPNHHLKAPVRSKGSARSEPGGQASARPDALRDQVDRSTTASERHHPGRS